MEIGWRNGNQEMKKFWRPKMFKEGENLQSRQQKPTFEVKMSTQ